MRSYNILTILIIILLVIPVSATQLNGKVLVSENNGSKYKVLLQINTDLGAQKIGGATFVIDYDSTLLSYPDLPVNGTDYIFNNFTLGFYDTAKVTKVHNGRIWINIDLTKEGHGTIVQKGPDSWTDMVELTFQSTQILQNSVVSWDVNNKFWGVYDEDNLTFWDPGNFDLITYVENNRDNNISDYNLSQNYPNPFNPTTTIEFNVPQKSMVSLIIYNVIGQQVSILSHGEKEAGTYRINFDASGLASGIYLYRLTAGNFVQTKKMILLK